MCMLLQKLISLDTWSVSSPQCPQRPATSPTESLSKRPAVLLPSSPPDPNNGTINVQLPVWDPAQHPPDTLREGRGDQDTSVIAELPPITDRDEDDEGGDNEEDEDEYEHGNEDEDRDNESENKDEDEDRITLMTFMSEEDWKNIGIQGTPGWYHFRKGKNFQYCIILYNIK